MLTPALTPRFPAVSSADGWQIELVDGSKLYDLSGQTFNLAYGQCHPAISAAVIEQIKTAYFASSRFSTEPYLRLNEVLCDLAPVGINVCILKLTNGSDAVETAIKISRAFSNRSKIGVLEGAWHGETIFCLGLSSKHRSRPVASASDVRFVSGKSIESLVSAVRSCEDFAAVIVDPGMIALGLCDANQRVRLKELREACDAKNVILIFDEVQTFGGYLGNTLFASDYFDVEPDIICIGKALGAGFPLAAVLCREKFRGVLQYNDAEFTYGGHPVACAASLAALELYQESQDRLQLLQVCISRFCDQLTQTSQFEVRNLGLMISITLAEEFLNEIWADRVVHDSMKLGLYVRTTDSGRRIFLKIPVIAHVEELIECLDKIKLVCNDVRASLLALNHLPDLNFPIQLDNQVVVNLVQNRRLDKDNTRRLVHQLGVEVDILKRSPRAQIELSRKLAEVGVKTSYYYHGLGDRYQKRVFAASANGRSLSDLKIDSGITVHSIGSLILRNFEMVAVAHSEGIAVGPRHIGKTIVSGNEELSFLDLSVKFVGERRLVFFVEEMICLSESLDLIRKLEISDEIFYSIYASVCRRFDGDHVAAALERMKIVGPPPINGCGNPSRIAQYAIC